MVRGGVAYLVGRTNRKLARRSPADELAFARDMQRFPIAIHTDDANEQHYEVPAAFFELVLGPRRKYSCCLYDGPQDTLEQAEIRALDETVAHAGLQDGQAILELGCGWGSLTLFMAERFPAARIVSVSNSASQRRHIEDQARRLGFHNLEVVTANMTDFSISGQFDRIVSVEMFEHMSNWRALLERSRNWVKPGGKLFLHVFSHINRSYRFDTEDKSDWIAQHFFTGGIMPSHDLVRHFNDLYRVEEEWRWPGRNYERTAIDWLTNFDRNDAAIMDILKATYGKDAWLWRRRWRMFFLATAGLFGHRDGAVWRVSHYRLAAP